MKAQQIARLIVKGVTRSRIAVEMGMSYDGLSRIIRTPEYLQIEEQVRGGVIAQMDERLKKRAEMNDIVEDAVPEAMKVLLDGVLKKRDMKAALELLDRDPKRQFSKSQAGKVADPIRDAPQLHPDALASVVAQADITHSILEGQQKTVILGKPAEA